MQVPSYIQSNATAGKVGFIGLGQMGLRMAQNLVKKGHELVVYDVADAPIKTLVDEGNTTAVANVKEVADAANVVITMLPSNPHVIDVYLESSNALIRSATAEHLFIDASTIDPNVARDVQGKVTDTGAGMIDAPVSGGVNGAANGTLTFMVGGVEQAFIDAKPYLSCMGANLVYCGSAGNGQVAKVCNNLLLGISMVGVSEGIVLFVVAYFSNELGCKARYGS